MFSCVTRRHDVLAGNTYLILIKRPTLLYSVDYKVGCQPCYCQLCYLYMVTRLTLINHYLTCCVLYHILCLTSRYYVISHV